MKKKDIHLSDHFSYSHLLHYTFPAIIMMVFTSAYIIVDGFFISNFVGKIPFAAINFIMPFITILGCIGFMFGTGGSALIAKTLGEGKKEEANDLFSLIIYAALLTGILLSIFSIFFLNSIVTLLGAKGQLAKDSITYGKIILLALPFYILQDEFQCLFATAGKPKFGLIITVIAGFTNIILDALFVVVFHWGLEGAAIATIVSQIVGGIIPLYYFTHKNDSYLRLGSCHLNLYALFKTCTNGASELLGNISASIVSLLFNLKLMQYVGEDGVAAYGVLMYVSMIFQAIFMGYSMGITPVIGYHFGAKNYKELKSLRKKSLLLIIVFSIGEFFISQLFNQPLSMIFFSYDSELLKMTIHAFSIFSISFLLSGIGIFGSAFFTALNDGVTSALISFLRIFVFQCSAVLVLPIFLKLDGIWISIVVAETLSVIMTWLFFIGKQKKFYY